MKATLYEALGVTQTASDEEIRAALRRLIRRYYARARDGQGDVEEALRFINHASRVLGNPELRRRYDEDLGLSPEGLTERGIDDAVAVAIASVPDLESGADLSPGADFDLLPGEEPAAPATKPVIAQTGLAQTVGYFGRSRYAQIVVTLAVVAFAGVLAWLAVPQADLATVARSALVSVTALLVVVAAIYGVVYVLSIRRRRAAVQRVLPQTDLAVFNWRREETVFLGAERPVEDAGWVFQLRMAELERARARRTSEPRPWRRLAARLFDYGVWGVLLAVAVVTLEREGLISNARTAWLLHPLVAPILISATWVPIEALLGRYVRTTPGKWLFAVFVQFAISDAYAARGSGTEFKRWLGRAFRVWLRGVVLGIPFLAPFAMAYAAERLRREQETSWDYDGDCLVTQGGISGLNGLASALSLSAMGLLVIIVWAAPVARAVGELSAQVQRLTAMARQHADAGVSDLSSAASELRSRIPATASAAAETLGSARDAAPAATDSPALAVAAAAVEPEAAAVLRRDRALAAAKVDGPGGLREGNFPRAVRGCETWVEIEPSNAYAWRCYGKALGAVGRHRESVSAFRRALALAPDDEDLKAAVARSEQAMLNQFRNRYGATN